MPFLAFVASFFLFGAYAAPAGLSILILGDSLTEGYGVTPAQAFPAVLEKLYHQEGKAGVQVHAGGIAGATSAGAGERLKWHLRSHPQIVILALGANDGLRGLPPAEMEKNLADAIKFAKAQGVKVLLAGMKVPPNMGRAYAKKFEATFRRLSGRYRVPLIPFLLEGVAGEAALNIEDGIHPNEKGHTKIAALVKRYLQPLVNSAP